MECEYCLLSFENEELLKKHNIECETCNKYKNILFTCKKCDFSTIGIINIDNHIENNCVEKFDDISYEVISDDTVIDIPINVDNSILQRIEKKLDDLLLHAKSESKQPENKKFKNSDIKKNLSEIDNIEVYKNTNYDNIINTINNDYLSNCSSLSETKKSVYKTLKTQLDLREETTDDKNKLETLCNQIEKKKMDIAEYLKETENTFKQCFNTIRKQRSFSKHLDNIKKLRFTLINVLPYNTYINLIEYHNKKLTTIFKEKEYNEKKIIECIFKSMNNIDLRLLNYGKYYETYLEVDEIHKLKESLKFFNSSLPKFVPFNKEHFFQNFFNYGLAIFTIKDNIECYVSNIYGINNLIYIPIKNSNIEDPYSFYALEYTNTEKKTEKRYWKLDCRLEDITKSFIDNIKPYCVKLFRKLYYDTFKDNDYRDNYKTANMIMEFDCEQLLQNIFLLCDIHSLSIIFRNVIVNTCSYIPSKNDRVNLYSDDTYQKKKFLNKKDNSNILFETVKLLFDTISNEEIVDFYRNK